MTATNPVETGVRGPGDLAPDFDLPDTTGRRVSLCDLLGEEDERRVVLFFYPKPFTQKCTTEVGEFSLFAAELRSLGAGLVGISRDEPGRLASFATENGVDYPLLSDATGAVHRAYGVLRDTEVDGRTVEKVRRTTLVVGAERQIRQAWYDVDVDGHAATVAVAVRGVVAR